MSLSDLRVRLEGRLEVLEAAASHLEALDLQLRGGTWADVVNPTRRHLRDWAELAPRLEEAIAAAHRLNADEPLARLATLRAQLSQSIRKHLARTGVVRRTTLEDQLAQWLRLVEATGLPPRTERLLGEASVQVRSRAWLAIGALAVVMLLVKQRIPAGALMLLAGAAYVWLQHTFRYRLFPDALVVERTGEPPVEVPLISLQRGEARSGTTLRGLVDVELPATDQLRPFCTLLNRVLAERLVLIEEQRALAEVEGPTGVWASGRWSPSPGEGPTAVEVLQFEKGATVQMVAGSEPSPIRGLALVLEQGLLFVPQRAESSVRELLFETGWIDLLTEERIPLSNMPERLFVDHLDALRGVSGVIWIAGRAQVPGVVALPEGELWLEAIGPT